MDANIAVQEFKVQKSVVIQEWLMKIAAGTPPSVPPSSHPTPNPPHFRQMILILRICSRRKWGGSRV